ncbi:hypothetical protein HNP84_003675 [Thermocatellispora tengchongensis]|uniref:DUF4178 domain-containing protein n=1 Tax=Thermocatellispora tengchongensis TaxID=1073253 RepID=A0A840P4L7_9ACTN|nr:DUF4178 domain-containing protein [Thermocatellispora tengchongensis]MBB5133949.1 hypothetical protein [Thermocatellispora tengchongensis]
MTFAVVLGLSVAMLVLLLVAYIATTRQDRKARASALPAEPPPRPDEDRGPVFAAPSRPSGDFPDPRTIKVGDTVGLQGMRARVLGALHWSWRGKEWTEYLLEEGVRRYHWLSVEELKGATDDDPVELEVQLWTSVPTQGMVPAKSMLIMEGVEFYPVERGTAAFRSEGETFLPDRGLIDFADYRANDGRLLSFERVQGQSWTASYASPLPPGSITIERGPGA